MQISEAGTTELFTALAEAQGAIGNAGKNAKNPHFKSSYADLASATNVSREHLAANGLGVVQSPAQSGNEWVLTTLITHKAGGWMRSDTPLLIGKKDMQGFGSALTYARRYALMSMLNIAAEDDDGNGSSNGDAAPLSAARVRPEYDPHAALKSLEGTLFDTTDIEGWWKETKAARMTLKAADGQKYGILEDRVKNRRAFLSQAPKDGPTTGTLSEQDSANSLTDIPFGENEHA